MEEYKGRCASSGKEKMHEQNHPHPKAQRPAVVCGGAGVRGAVRGAARYKLWALLIALGGAAVMFGAAKKVCPPRVVEHEVPFHTGSGDVDEMLADIQQKLDALHALNEALPDPELSAAMTRMEKAGRSIVETVEASPAKAKQVRRFANYYLPDAVNVLEQYAKLARQGVRGENAASIRAEVERNAASIATAFENQLDALYAAESMDLSADLTVLQNMLKGQGLG